MRDLTQNELSKLTNIDAFNFHFNYVIKAYKPYKGRISYYVIEPDAVDPWHSYHYYTENLQNLNGWLYGCVQTICGVIKSKEAA